MPALVVPAVDLARGVALVVGAVGLPPVDSPDDVTRWEELGVTRLVISPWRRSPEAVAGIGAFADLVGLEPRAERS